AKYIEEAIAQGALSGPAVDEMRKNLTQLRVATGKPSEVIKALEPRVKSGQATPEELIGLAAAYLESKRYKEALPLAQKAVASTQNPDETWLQALYAAQVGVGQEKDAAPVLEKLVRRNPGRREYWLQLAGLYYKAGNKERSLAVLELACRQGHLQTAEERLQLISLTAQQGMPFEAGSLLRRAINDGEIPKNAENLEALAGFWVAARESTLAAEALRDATQQSRKADLFLQLGQILEQRDEYAEAAVALNEGLKDARTDRAGPVLLALGVAAFNAGNVDGAMNAFTGASRFPA